MPGLPWFKVETSILDDRDLAAIPAEYFRLHIYLKAMAQESEEAGTIRDGAEHISWRSRVPLEHVEKGLILFQEMGLVEIEGSTVTLPQFKAEQFKRKKNAVRQQTFRDRNATRNAENNARSNAPPVEPVAPTVTEPRNGGEESRGEEIREEKRTTPPGRSELKATSPRPVESANRAASPGGQASLIPLDSEVATWPPALREIRAELDKLKAPKDLYDAEYWLRIVQWLLDHPTIFIADELKRYLAWLYARPANQQHRDRKRAFQAWLARTVDRAANGDAREAQKQDWRSR